MHHFHAAFARAIFKLWMDFFKNAFFVFAAHAVQKQRPGAVDVGNGLKTALARGDGQTKRVAATVAGGHKNGGGFTP